MERQLEIIAYLLARIIANKEKASIDSVLADAKDAIKRESAKRTKPQETEVDYEAVDYLYSLYPGKSNTPTGVRSTGKCSKDKVRLASLLRTHTREQIERSITKYIEEQGGMYLKNFSTFLNNLPEYEEEAPPKQEDGGYIDF